MSEMAFPMATSYRRRCHHPSWHVRCYRDYGVDDASGDKFYYVACGCGMVLLDGKWQQPSEELLKSRQTDASLPVTHACCGR